jgi:trans-2,3-dihydro-3-hydroxyanthranilate isomerase
VLSYDVVDVFTDRAFAGNPLAVVHGAAELSDGQLLAPAREFNLSETTFPDDASPGHTGDSYAVRIFTPAGEIPFAGHPTLGTAWVLRQHGRLGADTVVQRCGAGDVEVRVPEDPQGVVRLRATPRDLAGPVDASPVAEAVGLSARQVAGQVFVAGCGLSGLHLLVDGELLRDCRPGPDVDAVLAGLTDLRDPVAGVNVYAAARDDGAGDGDTVTVRSRVFCPDVGVVEDPTTGSAAAGLGIVLVATGLLPEGGGFTISQGVEMGRPSVLRGQVRAEDGRARWCEVAGGVVSVAAGTIAVPDL